MVSRRCRGNGRSEGSLRSPDRQQIATGSEVLSGWGTVQVCAGGSRPPGVVRMGPGVVEKCCHKERGGWEMLPSARPPWRLLPAHPDRRPEPRQSLPTWWPPGAGVTAQHGSSKPGLRS